MAKAVNKLLKRLQSEVLDPKLTLDSTTSDGFKFTYIPTENLLDHMNDVFGHLGWTREIKTLDSEVAKLKNGDYYCNAEAVVEIGIIIDGFKFLERQGVGYYGSTHRSKIKASNLARQKAVDDAMFKAVRTFGALFGNDLYKKKNSSESKSPRKVGSKKDLFDLKGLGPEDILKQFKEILEESAPTAEALVKFRSDNSNMLKSLMKGLSEEEATKFRDVFTSHHKKLNKKEYSTNG